MDIFIIVRDYVFNLIYNLPIGLTSVILRMGFLFALTSLLLMIFWMHFPWRTVFSQTCVALLSLTIALYTPVEQLKEGGKEFLTLFIFLAIFSIIFLSNKISFWLTPRLGTQIKLGRIIKSAVWIILIIQIILW